jgi:hypothetical protein
MLGHQGDDEGLGNGLAFLDRQGMVGISLALIGRRNKEMPGNPPHGLQNAGVGNPPGLDLHGDHGPARTLEHVFGRLRHYDAGHRQGQGENNELSHWIQYI